jgi:phosphoribosylamine--glycine ligase
MRYLGVGESCDLGALYWRLAQDGHDVKIFIADPRCASTFDGLLEKTTDWRTELSWLGQDGILLFESVLGGAGSIQDDLRAEGYRVVGGSAFGDRLENDRAFAQHVLQTHDFQIIPHWAFERPTEAIEFVLANPSRYVLKFNGYGPMTSFTGRLADGTDVAAMLRHLGKLPGEHPRFVLTKFVDGVEMGVGAYFNGNKFLFPACLDWEHKKFFTGDLGELTPEMGTVVTYDRTSTFFALTLKKLEHILSENRYRGYINLNTIVNEQGIWPLEFTCRFGYPGFAILERLQKSSWHQIFEAILAGGEEFETFRGFATGIVLTTPPFPYSRLQVSEPIDIPIGFAPGLEGDEKNRLHYGEVRSENGQLRTSGMYGWTMVVTGSGETIESASDSAYALAEKVLIPNVRYRLDIGEKLKTHDWTYLYQLGYLGE